MGVNRTKWPRDITSWQVDNTLHLSVPFTWLLPKAAEIAMQKSWEWDAVIVGGPAALLMPEYFDGLPWVTVGSHYDGVLARVNPQATRTTLGCVNACPFCAVPKLEGAFRELDDWPDLPVLIDNNLLAASQAHLDRVFDRLERWGWADFNQGLDARRLTDYHAERISRIGKPIVRLALDFPGMEDQWEVAFDLLRRHGVPKRAVHSYALIGFNSGPDECWARCEWIEGHGALALPMWFHELDALECNIVTEKQRNLGWTDLERRKIMRWYYKHSRTEK